MSVLKTKINIAEVEEFLRANFSTDIVNVQKLKGGEISQAFSFEDSKNSYVIKIRKVKKEFTKMNPFEKERLIYEILKERNPQVPIPKKDISMIQCKSDFLHEEQKGSFRE